MRRPDPVPAVALLLVLLAAPALAQDNPDTGRGFKADKVYRFGQLDSVNLFNGNLTLVLPLGASYPVNGNLSYALTLTYNSNVWRFNDFQWWQPDGGIVSSRVASLERTNAGPGWRLTLGELQDALYPFNDGTQWAYVGQDGAHHASQRELAVIDALRSHLEAVGEPVPAELLAMGAPEDGPRQSSRGGAG